MNHLNRPFEVKSIDEQGLFEGYGNVFGVQDHYRDVVEPGAFSKTLQSWQAKGRLPALLWQHNSDKPIGVYESMREDHYGLHVRGRLLIDDVPLAREAWALLKAGAINGLSIGYSTVLEERDINRVNHIKEIDLWEVSLVTFPANAESTVTHIKTIREFEKFLRDSGFSRQEAVRIASSGFETQRDAAEDEAEEEAVQAALMQNIQSFRRKT